MIMKISSFHTTLLLIISIFTLLGCSSSSEEEQKVDDAKAYDITIGYAAWPGYEIVYYPQVKKIFQEYGIKVKIHRYSDQEAAQKAMDNLEIDGTLTTVWDALLLHSNNEFNIILATDISAGSDGIVAQKEIKNIKELKGKKISAQHNAVNMLILLEALQKSNMSYDDVTIIDITNEEALAQIYHHNIDAAVLWEPLLTKTKERIDGNIIFTTKEVNSSVIDILLVSEQSLKSKKDIWKKFIFAWFDTMKTLRTNPNEVIEIVSQQTINPNFEKDYKGLKPGTIELNNNLFTDGGIEKTIEKIDKYINLGKRSKVTVATDFYEEALNEWKAKNAK